MRTPSAHSCKKVVTLFRADTTAGRQQLQGFFRYIKEKSCRWQLVLRIHDDAQDPSATAHFAEADGFVFSETEADQWISILSDSAIPVVSLDAPRRHLSNRTSNIVFLNVNNKLIGEMAAEHLLEKGKPRTAIFIHDSENRYWSQQREKSFRDAIASCGVPVFTAPQGNEETLARWLKPLSKPLIVMAAYDAKAAQFIEACRLAQLEIPSQAILIGVDNDPFYCDYTTPTLSSVELNFEYEGYRAAEELDKLMRSRTPKPPKHIQLPPTRVVERESSANIVPAATLIRNALTFIKDNATKGISVSDVVKSMHVSRRLADLRFRQLHGKTINESIVEAKITAAEHLLKVTSLSLIRIAKLTGFSDAKYMMRLFRRTHGITMTDYRNRAETSLTPSRRRRR